MLIQKVNTKMSVETSESPVLASPEQQRVEHHVMKEDHAMILSPGEQATLDPLEVFNTNGVDITIAPLLTFTQERGFGIGEGSGDQVVVFRGNTKKYEEDQSDMITVARLRKGHRGLHITEYDTYAVNADKPGKDMVRPAENLHTADVGFEAVPMGRKGDSWKVAVIPRRQSTEAEEVTVTVPEGSDIAFPKKGFHELSKGYERRERWKDRAPKWGKRILVAAGMYTALASGGVTDKVIDQFQDAGTHVSSVLPGPQLEGGKSVDSLDPKSKARFLEMHKQEITARDNIIRTMSELDSHQTEGIQARGEQFRQEHAAELFNLEQSEQIIDSIAQADSIEGASRELKKFLDFYGLSLELDQKSLAEADVTIAKSYMQDIVRAFAPLPKRLITHGHDSHVSVSTPPRLTGIEISTTQKLNKSEDKNSGGVKAAYFSRGKNKMVVGVPSRVVDTVIRTQDAIFPTALGGNVDVKSTILHELTHAMQNYSYGSTLAPNTNMLSAIPSFAAHDLIGTDEYQSLYGQVGGNNEDEAEAGAHILDPTEGPSHPDQAREFSSKANTTRLKVLLDIEEAFPGFTDYMVSQGLIERQVFDIH